MSLKDNFRQLFRNGSRNGLAIFILLVGIFLIPNNDYVFFNANNKFLHLSIFIALFYLINLFFDQPILTFSSIDIAWILLICLTGCSAFWALNGFYAIYGLFSTLLLYLCYKSFESIKWTPTTNLYLLVIISLALFLGIEFQVSVMKGKLFSSIFSIDAPRIDKSIYALYGVNLHYVGSLIVVLLPYVIFRNDKYNWLISFILLTLSFWIIYNSSSAQVTLVLLILIFLYLLYKLNFTIRHKIYTVLLLGMLTGAGVWFIIKSDNPKIKRASFLINEFYQQNDRLLMWENSLRLFADAPILGKGKNNWELAVGEYNYNYTYNNIRTRTSFSRFMHAHNSFFQLISELGLIGLVLYFLIGILPFLPKVKKYGELSHIEIAAGISFFLFLLLSLMYGVVYNYFYHYSALTVVAVLSLAILHKKNGHKVYYFLENSKIRPLIFALAALSSTFFFYNTSTDFKNFIGGNFHAKIKKNEIALDYYNKSYDYWRTSELYLNLGELYEKEGALQKAMNTYEYGLLRDPYHLELLRHLGAVHYKQAMYKEALEYAKRAEMLFSGYTPNLLLLMKSYYQTGNVEEAIAYAKIIDTKINENQYLEKIHLLDKDENKLSSFEKNLRNTIIIKTKWKAEIDLFLKNSKLENRVR